MRAQTLKPLAVRRRRLLTAVVLLAVTGCTRGEDGGDAADQSTESASTTTMLTTFTGPASATAAATSSTTSSTTAPPTTSIVPVASDRSSSTSSTSSTTTQLPTTTAAPNVVDGLVLRADGIGPIAFGTSEAETLAVLEAELGAVASDYANTYGIDRGDGTYVDDVNNEVFVHPAQHTTCFDNALCVVFGGASSDSLALVGWVQNNQGVGPPLTTGDGVTVGSIWADHVDDLDVSQGGCYSIGYGTTSGISVLLSSAGDPFLLYDDKGAEIPTDPDPADVTVLQLSAGTRPGNPEENEC